MPSLQEIGTVNFDPEVDPSLLPSHLASCLSSVDANAVEVRGNRVTFEGGMFRFVMNWNVLVPFGFGDLTVGSETHEVRYCLSYRQLVISSTIPLGIAAAFVFLSHGFRGMSRWTIFLPVLWFFVTCVNLIVGISRFEGFLERCVATAPRTSRRTDSVPL